MRSTEQLYLLQWLPRQQIWFCLDYGFAFIMEDDGYMRIVQGTGP
jgi:hypothetical protein